MVQGTFKKGFFLLIFVGSCMNVGASVDKDKWDLIKGIGYGLGSAFSFKIAASEKKKAEKNAQGMFIFAPLFLIKPLAWTGATIACGLASIYHLRRYLQDEQE